jgi:hypothetical protein
MKEKLNLKEKITKYLLGHVDVFKQSNHAQDELTCFKNIKDEHENLKDSFIAGLADEEQKLVEKNEELWFLQLKSKKEFFVFLSNNEITL